MQDKILQKFNAYWFGNSGDGHHQIQFSRSEIFYLLEHFSSAGSDGNYLLALETGLRMFPEDIDFLSGYVEYLMRTGRWDAAEKELNRLLTEQYHDPRIRFLYAGLLIHRKEYERAVKTLEQLPEDFKSREKVWRQLSKAYEQTNEPEKAADYYLQYLKKKAEKLKKIPPAKKRMKLTDDLDKYMHLAKNIYSKEEIIESMEQLIEIDRKNTDLWLNLGDLYAAIKLLDRAMQCYEQAGLLDENYLSVHYKKAELFEKKGRKTDLLQAVKHYMKTLHLSPSAFANYRIGKIFHSLEYPDIAELYFENAIYEDPAYIPAWLDLIDSMEKRNRTEEALAKCKEALTHIHSKNLFEKAGDLYRKLHRPEKAAECYRKSYDLGNHQLDFLLKYSDILAQNSTGLYREILIEARYLYPDSPEIKQRMISRKNEKED